MSKTHPPELRERALRVLAEVRPDHPSDWAEFTHVAGKRGVNPETLRNWKRKAEIDTGEKLGPTSQAQAKELDRPTTR